MLNGYLETQSTAFGLILCDMEKNNSYQEKFVFGSVKKKVEKSQVNSNKVKNGHRLTVKFKNGHRSTRSVES